MQHRLTDVDQKSRTAVCFICGPVKIKKISASNFRCGNKVSEKKNLNRRKHRRYLKDKCSFCGFIPINLIQLDVDHIDGNKNNNNPDNLQTLCANCHRLKTYLNRDFDNKK